MNMILSKLIPVALAAALVTGCGSATTANTTTEISAPAALSAQAAVATNNTTATNTQIAAVTPAVSAATAAAEKAATRPVPTATTVQAGAATRITLDNESTTIDGAGANVDGSRVMITAAGTYEFSGTLTDGQIVVDTGDEESVTLVLNGVDINNSTGAPLYIADAENVALVLADGSTNRVTDGANYVFASAEEDEPNAAVFSKADLTIGGSGALTVAANYNDGIASKDGLTITGGMITVEAVDDGIRGKDYLVVEGGTLTVTVGGDGLKADNEEDAALGYISIEKGIFNITAGGDAITGETDVLILAGDFTLTSGGGSSARLDESVSAKGIKAGTNVDIDSGTFVIDAADDAIHSNTNIVINGGAFTIATGDDGVHADTNLTVNGGTLDITRSYEGIESAVITLNGGDVHVVSSDDAVNVAGDNDGAMGGRPGGDAFGGAASGQTLNINDGYLYVDAGGDGLDVNGTINMTAGLVIVNGPTEQMNGALDHSGFTISGGFIVAVGSAGMAQTADASSTQNALLLNFNSTLPAGTLINIRSSAGQDVLTFKTAKAIQSIAFSSPELKSDETYEVSYGGQATGEAADGLYEGGSYSGGTAYTTFTVSGVVTAVGNVGGFGGRGRRP